jgi:hypothetical protein
MGDDSLDRLGLGCCGGGTMMSRSEISASEEESSSDAVDGDDEADEAMLELEG